MPVNTPHPDYCAAAPDWKLVRDCVAGSRAVKEAGPCYLPKLHKQEPLEYDAYRSRALFVNVTSRILEAMIGLLFRKPPAMDLKGLDDVVADADLNSAPFLSYSRTVLSDMGSVGRGGSLVEWSTDEGRPYLAYYPAESIINWSQRRVNGQMKLDLLVLQEGFQTPNPNDPFVPICGLQWRVIQLNADGFVEWAVWRPKNITTGDKAAAQSEFQVVEGPVVMERRQPLDTIPFVFHNADAPGCGVGRVPLADLAYVNVSHYQTSADLENGRHVAGIPTPYAVGFGKGEYYLGTNYVWTSENPDAKAGFVEFTGVGMDSLKTAITEKEGQMAALGARLIEPKAKDAEAYETVVVRATAEASTLARIGLLGTESLTEVLAWCAWWMGTAPTMEDAATGLVFTLNKDFVSASLDPTMLQQLVAAYQQNSISWETLFYNLQRGELVPEGVDAETERQAITDNPPMPPPAPPAPAGGPPKPAPAK